MQTFTKTISQPGPRPVYLIVNGKEGPEVEIPFQQTVRPVRHIVSGPHQPTVAERKIQKLSVIPLQKCTVFPP